MGVTVDYPECQYHTYHAYHQLFHLPLNSLQLIMCICIYIHVHVIHTHHMYMYIDIMYIHDFIMNYASWEILKNTPIHTNTSTLHIKYAYSIYTRIHTVDIRYVHTDVYIRAHVTNTCTNEALQICLFSETVYSLLDILFH